MYYKSLILSLLLVLSSFFGRSQTYSSDTVLIYDNYEKPEHETDPLSTTINLYVVDTFRYIKITFNWSGRSVVFRRDSEPIKTSPSGKEIMTAYFAVDTVGKFVYIITFVLVDDQPVRIGFNDGVTLTVFYIKKEEKQSNAKI